MSSAGCCYSAADDEGRVEAALFDTWHQQPGLMQLTGTRDGDRIEVAATYLEEWGWEVGVELGADAVSMTMRNVVPESALAMLPPPTVRRWAPARMPRCSPPGGASPEPRRPAPVTTPVLAP